MTKGFLTFAIISGLGWLIDVAVTMGLVQMGSAPFVASLIGAGLAVTFVYVVSRLVIFGTNRQRATSDYAIYVVWQVFAIAVASLLVAILARLLEPFAIRLLAGEGNQLAQVLSDPLATATGLGKVIVTPLTLGANFLFVRWLAQRKVTAHDHPATGERS